MTLLDCSDLETALSTLAAGIGVDAAELERGLREYDETRFDDPSVDPAVGMPLDVLASFGVAPGDLNLEGVCCFHGTRVLDPEDFRRRGVLPLDQMLDEIWLTLFGLVRDACSEEQWARFRRAIEEEDGGGHDGDLYRMKTADAELHGGPFAHYVRECSVRPDEAMHDYLDCPEIVQDIARCFRQLYGIDLESRYREASVPCVVKFRVAEVPRLAIEDALSYAFWMLREGTLAVVCGGPDPAPVLPEDVLAVELIERA